MCSNLVSKQLKNQTMDTRKSTVSVFLILVYVQVVYSQVDPVIGTCSNTVMVMTKEEMKREIRAQVADALANGESLNCNSTETTNSNIYEAIENLGQEINNKLEVITRKLSSLHILGMTASHPATSCQEIYNLNPNTPSGYYWLQSTNDSAVHVYCVMTLTCKGVGGGWMQVAKLDMTNSSHQCPPGTRLRTHQAKRLCGIGVDGPGCSSSVFNIYGIEYNQVCGKIIGYQYATPDTFGAFLLNGRYHRNSNNVDGNYVDGISLTHGRDPRKHIWTFAGGLDEVGSHPPFNCPCTNILQAASTTQPPSFVRNDYFCDTGSTDHWQHYRLYNDSLWDGAGCGPANICCSLNNPPWFLKQLPSTTTDDIEMRMCIDQARDDEDTPIEIIELYIR